MDTFPGWVRITHVINFVFIGVLIRSGIDILSSHPRLYWNNHCTPGTDWIRFTKRVVPAEEGQYMARDDELVLPKWFSLPGGKKTGLGRRWHGVTKFLWIFNGPINAALLFGTGQWRRLVPTSGPCRTRVDTALAILDGGPVASGGQPVVMARMPNLLAVYCDDLDDLGHRAGAQDRGLG